MRAAERRVWNPASRCRDAIRAVLTVEQLAGGTRKEAHCQRTVRNVCRREHAQFFGILFPSRDDVRIVRRELLIIRSLGN